MDQGAVRRALLARAYANNEGTCVAFIDESYVAPGFAFTPSGGYFFLVTAYVVPVHSLEDMRADLGDVLGARYWHSTEEHKTREGRARILRFTHYIGEGIEPTLVSLRRPIDPEDRDGEIARAACFRALLASLSAGSHCDPVSLAIFEERKFTSQRNADEATIKSARRDSLIPRHMHVMPMSPTFERMLWLPDVASFALYQHHSTVRSDYAQPFRDRVIEIRA